jgi:sulfite reductase (ferredoxin)
LIKDLGLEKFRELLVQEENDVPMNTLFIDPNPFNLKVAKNAPKVHLDDKILYEEWKSANIISQKQTGFVAIGIKVFLGDFYTKQARQLADLVETYAAGELRLSLRQNILIPFVPIASLPFFFSELQRLGLSDIGYSKAIDITACPGTDTCNLGIASSTGIAAELERIIRLEYPHYVVGV